MREYLLVSALAVSLYVLALFSIVRGSRHVSASWQLLGYSGVPLAAGGLGFILRFWHPTPGPYMANSVYPFGPHLNAWAVSFGFMWIGYGLLFTFVCFHAAHEHRKKAWALLLVSWFLAWLPHGVIGVAFAVAGANRESIDFYARWASDRSGFLLLLRGALIMFSHFALAIGGFVATGLQIMKSRSTYPAAA